jgi:RNA-directed DNA polymerase
MTRAPEPKDKLDAAMIVAVNGPEGGILDGDAADWRSCEERVRRLRQQIPRACLSRMLGNGHLRF